MEKENIQNLDFEDFLTSALWVDSLTDSSLHSLKLHETFISVIFFSDSNIDDNRLSLSSMTIVKSAAELQREEKEKLTMKKELHDLQFENSLDGNSSDSFEEEGEEDFVDDGFSFWIYNDQYKSVSDKKHLEQSAALEMELGGVFLGRDHLNAASDLLPERYKYIEMKEGRTLSGSKELSGGYTYDIPLEHEAFWILRQLRNAGQPLAHNTQISAIANRSQAEVADEPVILALQFAITKMTREYFEPAFLMMYHQADLQPLLCALLQDSPFFNMAQDCLPISSYAYSTKTGRRQRPVISEKYVGFSYFGDNLIGEGDAMWLSQSGIDWLQRKPCFIELGRLLVRILELDILCHKLEHHRQSILLLLNESIESYIQNQLSILRSIVFETSSEAELWRVYAQFLRGETSQSPTVKLKQLNLEEAFEEYSISGIQFQENIISKSRIHFCSTHTQPLIEWASAIGSTLMPSASAEFVISLFNRCIVEQYSVLPILSKQLLELFCSEGNLLVFYIQGDRRYNVYPLSSFFVEHPRYYLDLLDLERQKMVELQYIIPDKQVKSVLNIENFYHDPMDLWSIDRDHAIDLLVNTLIDNLIPKVKAELLLRAKYHTTNDSVRRLGFICSRGPYQPTRLCIENFHEDLSIWESQWNVVEALPISKSIPNNHSRVCACYRAKNGISSFAFIDENGVILGTLRWLDYSLSSGNGRAVIDSQNMKLEELIKRCSPHVIAVGASDVGSFHLMKSLQQFLQERIFTTLCVKIPIVWIDTEIAHCCSFTSFARSEIEGDSIVRMSVALARYIQDPLHAVCTLFDKERTVLNLPLCDATYSKAEEQEQLFNSFCWELSLWVSACGLDITTCRKRPNILAQLQFISGLGRIKGSRFLEKLFVSSFSDKKSLFDCMNHLFGSYVSVNALNFLRLDPADIDLPPYGSASFEVVCHPLDSALLPLSLYPVTEYLLYHLSPDNNAAMTALVDFYYKPEHEKRALLHSIVTNHQLASLFGALKQSEFAYVPFLTDQLLASGESYLRRPYRCLSARELMLCITGTLYISQDASSMALQKAWEGSSSTLVVKEGVYMTGTIHSMRIGNHPGIKILTSIGLSAFMSLDDIVDETLKSEAKRYLEYLAKMKDKLKPTLHENVDYDNEDHIDEVVVDANGNNTKVEASAVFSLPTEPSYSIPSWLIRHSPIQGTVLRCHWEKCELQLRWCRPKVTDDAFYLSPNTNHSLPMNLQTIYPHLPPLQSQYSRDPDLSNILYPFSATDLKRTARILSTEVSRHTFFQDITSSQAIVSLRSRSIGSFIFHPSRRAPRQFFCVVKVGSQACLHLPLSEKRHTNGSFYYTLMDPILHQSLQFDAVSALQCEYLTPVMQRVEELRRHRRFHPPEDGAAPLLSLADPTIFSYRLCEAAAGRHRRRTAYVIATAGGGKTRDFSLHITPEAFYVYLPHRQMENNNTVAFRWMRGNNIEQITALVKEMARAIG